MEFEQILEMTGFKAGMIYGFTMALFIMLFGMLIDYFYERIRKIRKERKKCESPKE